MADLTTGGSPKSKGPKTNKKSTKIDMTAMVDVAFLLLTFFVLTATMASEGVKELMLPPSGLETKLIDQEKVMTIVLGENDLIQYYIGVEDVEIFTTDLSNTGIREAIMRHIEGDGLRPNCAEVDNRGLSSGACWDPLFVVKAKEKSTYRNLVDILDELSLTGAPKYALDDYTDEDSIRISQALESALAAQ